MLRYWDPIRRFAIRLRAEGRRGDDRQMLLSAVSRGRHQLMKVVLTLGSSTAGSGTLGLLHHTQLVGDLLALARNATDGVLRLVMRRHHRRPGCHC